MLLLDLNLEEVFEGLLIPDDAGTLTLTPVPPPGLGGYGADGYGETGYGESSGGSTPTLTLTPVSPGVASITPD